MCTSSSTTSGSSSEIAFTAESTSSASPTTWIDGPNSARTPDRNSRWSSTIRTRTVFMASSRLSFHGQHYLGAVAGGGLDPSAAAVALHPADDRLADAHAVVRHLFEVEALASVAD